MLSKKKKVFVLAGMFVLLAATAVLNYVIAKNNDPNGTQDVLATGSYFTQYRAERILTRNEELLILDSVMASTTEEYEGARAEAASQKVKLATIMEMEFALESLIKAQGFEDVVVNMGSQPDNVNVVVKTAELRPQDNAIIYTIVFEKTNVIPDNVHIIPIK